MISSIHIHNFLSYDDTTVPLGPLTVICGENLSGKTNLKRALEWCLLNKGTWSDDPLRDTIRREVDGVLAKEVKVTVVFSDNSSVTRFRSKTENSYMLQTSDGEMREIPTGSVGAGFCDDVGEFTGIKPVTWPSTGSNPAKCFIQFANDAQEGRFLLADGPYDVDRKLGTVMGIDVLEAATKQAATIATSHSRKMSELKTEGESVEKELDEYVGLEDAISQTQTAIGAQASADSAKEQLERCTVATGRLASAAEACSRYEGIDEALNLIKVDDAVLRALEINRAHEQAVSAVASLARVAGEPTDADVALLEQLSGKAGEFVGVAEIANAAYSNARDANVQVHTAWLSHSGIVGEVEQANESIAAILNTVSVCPLDGEMHDTCPYTGGAQ